MGLLGFFQQLIAFPFKIAWAIVSRLLSLAVKLALSAALIVGLFEYSSLKFEALAAHLYRQGAAEAAPIVASLTDHSTRSIKEISVRKDEVVKRLQCAGSYLAGVQPSMTCHEAAVPQI